MKDKYADLPIEIKQQHFDKLNDYNAKLRNKPELKTLFIEMTLQCNEHCKHCGSNCEYIINEDELLSDEEILECVTKLKTQLQERNEKLPFISVTGGEPLLRKTLITLMNKIHELGYNWGMTSNGLLIGYDVAKQLKEAGIFSISISIDGLEESHEWFRQTKGCYQRTLESVRNCIEVGIENVMVTTVVHKRNINELVSLNRLVRSLGCTLWRIVNVDPIGRALENKEILLNNEELKTVIDYIASHQGSNPGDLDIIYTCNHYLGLEYERKVRPWYFTCRAGTSIASIQYNGNITACLDIERRSDLVFGNIRKDDLLHVWLTEFKPFRIEKSLYSKTCKDCPDRLNCNGNGYHTWDFDNNEPRICMKNIISM